MLAYLCEPNLTTRAGTNAELRTCKSELERANRAARRLAPPHEQQPTRRRARNLELTVSPRPKPTKGSIHAGLVRARRGKGET
jgi:hypothetical protein